MSTARYAAADKVVTAIRRSGLRRDQLGSDVLRYALDALLKLVRDPTGRSEKFHDLLMFVLENEPTTGRRATSARDAGRWRVPFTQSGLG